MKIIREAYNKKQQRLIDYFKHIINLDITPMIEPSFTNNKFITVWWDEFSDLEQRQILRLAGNEAKSIFKIEPNGAKKMAFVFLE